MAPMQTKQTLNKLIILAEPNSSVVSAQFTYVGLVSILKFSEKQPAKYMIFIIVMKYAYLFYRRNAEDEHIDFK